MDIGIDLGTANILVYVKGEGVVLREPSIVAIDTKTKEVLAAGEEARRMLGRTPENITVIRPLKKGVISDFTSTEKMLKYFLEKTLSRKKFYMSTRIAICVPSGVTGVEKRAVSEAAAQLGGRKVAIIEEPIAAAIGAGIEISKAKGTMIVDIGGGTTDIAVISLGGIVVSNSIKVAGDDFNDAIARYIRKKYKLLIGERSAEKLKINIGTAFKREESVFMDIKGRDLVTGLPKNIVVTSEEMMEASFEPLHLITEAIHSVLEKTPPELSSDIADRGIIMTGGGSLLNGLNKLIKHKTGIETIIADDAFSCVALGTGKYVEVCDWKNI